MNEKNEAEIKDVEKQADAAFVESVFAAAETRTVHNIVKGKYIVALRSADGYRVFLRDSKGKEVSRVVSEEAFNDGVKNRYGSFSNLKDRRTLTNVTVTTREGTNMTDMTLSGFLDTLPNLMGRTSVRLQATLEEIDAHGRIIPTHNFVVEGEKSPVSGECIEWSIQKYDEADTKNNTSIAVGSSRRVA